MRYWLGVAAFALTILISVSLHELGHMITGKRFGMKVTKYFVGFGPTIFSFKRGETEYGLKAIPLGGFCKIVGMTPQDDDVAPEDQPRAMWRFPVWKRTIVMAAGSITHFALAVVGTWILAISFGLPNPDYPTTAADIAKAPARIEVSDCVALKAATADADCKPGVGDGVAGPAQASGLRNGDVITKVGDKPVSNWGDLTAAIRSLPAGRTTFTYLRDGATGTTDVNLVTAERIQPDDKSGKSTPVTIAAVKWDDSDTPGILHYTALTAVPGTFGYMGELFKGSFEAMKRIPQKVPALWHSLGGDERDPNTPISVVGASRLGGEAIEKGVPELFWSIFISLNVFIGIFNLLPLLPVDGGHIAIAWYEAIRSAIYRRLRKPDPGRVDYYKLMPLTYAVILIGGAFTLLTITADIINPITFSK